MIRWRTTNMRFQNPLLLFERLLIPMFLCKSIDWFSFRFRRRTIRNLNLLYLPCFRIWLLWNPYLLWFCVLWLPFIWLFCPVKRTIEIRTYIRNITNIRSFNVRGWSWSYVLTGFYEVFTACNSLIVPKVFAVWKNLSVWTNLSVCDVLIVRDRNTRFPCKFF